MELLRSCAKLRSFVTVSLCSFLDSSIAGCVTLLSPATSAPNVIAIEDSPKAMEVGSLFVLFGTPDSIGTLAQSGLCRMPAGDRRHLADLADRICFPEPAFG